MIKRKNIFHQPVNNNIKTYENNIKLLQAVEMITETTGCLLNFPYFRENYKLTAIDLSKQQTLDTGLRGI